MRKTILKGFAGILATLTALIFIGGWVPSIVLPIIYKNGLWFLLILAWIASCPITYAVTMKLADYAEVEKEEHNENE